MRPVLIFRPRSAARFAVAAVTLIVGHLLGSCSMPLADLPLVGMPENAPPRPETPAPYLPVHDLPAPRSTQVLTPDEQKKIERELAAARDKQARPSAQTNQ